jgi:sigma-B regulation protein RsbU (phosphoserine phosphatase)
MRDEEWVVAFVRDITERRRAEEEILRHREEFAAAREIQQQLLPSCPPCIPGLELAGCSEMAVAAGGDCFEYLTLGDGSLGLLVADVSGHGLGSALLMAEARAYFRLLAKQSDDPGRILMSVQEALSADLGEDRFITAALCVVDPVTRRLRYASAGHPPAHILSQAGQVRAVLDYTGPPIKQRLRKPVVTGMDHCMEPGDILVMVTDGIEEALNADESEFFGVDRLLQAVGEHRTKPLSEISRQVIRAVRQWTEPQPVQDDLTVVLARLLPPS